MTEPTGTNIIVRYNDAAAQWEAWFDGAPCVCYGGDFSMVAVHRLLEGSEIDACDLKLNVSHVQAGAAVLVREAVWQPPELLLPCEQCNGKGEYVGLAVVEKCGACRGKGWIPG